MTELVGDLCIPETLILNVKEGGITGATGEIFMSGSKIWFSPDGSSPEIVTSA